MGRICLALAVCFASLGAFSGEASAQRKKLYFDPGSTYRVPLGATGQYKGPEQAPVTIVEFSAYSCPYCLRARATVRQLVRLYPKQVRLVYRHNPLDPKGGIIAAQAVLAAGAQGSMWPMHVRLFSSPKPITRAAVEGYAAELGLDMARFRAALDQHTYLPQVLSDLSDARKLGAVSTPLFFINGRPIRGARPLSVFVTAVERELARANRARVATGLRGKRLYRALVRRGLRRGSPRPVNELVYQKLGGLRKNGFYRVGRGLPGHSRGNPDAPVTIVEMSDFACGFCARVQSRLARLRTKYGKDVRFVFRHAPLLPGGQLAAEASVEAARQGKFWAFHEQMFTRQAPITRAMIRDRARAAGLDLARLRRAMDRRLHRAAVDADALGPAILGVRGTPAFFINGTPIVGDRPIAEFEAIIDAKLAEARKLVAGGVKPADVYRTVVSKAPRGEKL
jgi:protein-disulfide isomerase